MITTVYLKNLKAAGKVIDAKRGIEKVTVIVFVSSLKIPCVDYPALVVVVVSLVEWRAP